MYRQVVPDDLKDYQLYRGYPLAWKDLVSLCRHGSLALAVQLFGRDLEALKDVSSQHQPISKHP